MDETESTGAFSEIFIIMSPSGEYSIEDGFSSFFSFSFSFSFSFFSSFFSMTSCTEGCSIMTICLRGMVCGMPLYSKSMKICSLSSIFSISIISSSKFTILPMISISSSKINLTYVSGSNPFCIAYPSLSLLESKYIFSMVLSIKHPSLSKSKESLFPFSIFTILISSSSTYSIKKYFKSESTFVDFIWIMSPSFIFNSDISIV